MKMGFDVDAFDASEEMVRHARELTGIPVQHRSFDQLDATHLYDGIWCCASLLHVRTVDLLEAMQPLAKALKENGVWYVSFKYGHEEREKEGRHFTDFNENLLRELVNKLNRITILSTWVTVDKRPDRNEQWLNALLKYQP
jgi:2-polyprenyl-3-methyl-5-hydroxy-6-metoxy-1,4-benzoquinol methylase